MALLQWDEGYLTGIAAADHEHQIMVDLLNSVYDGRAADDDHDPARLFDDLFNILLAHFGDEEREMSRLAHPGRAAHLADHERALEDLRTIAARADEPGYDLAGALSSCLQFWLVRHIRIHDVPLYEAVACARAGAKNRPAT